MKKILCIFLLLVLFAGCKPVDSEIYIEPENIQIENTDNTYHIETTIPYVKSTIPVEADIAIPEKVYSYKITKKLHPRVDAIYEVFPQLKGNLRARGDDEGQVIPATKYTGKESIIVAVNDEFGEIILRQQFQSEERIDNEYEKDENITFNMPYEQVEKLALDTAEKFFVNCKFLISDVRKYGKNSGENYYVFTLKQSVDGVTFSEYGRKTQTGKDDEGYNTYKTLKGGNRVTVYIDENGVSQISWRVQRVEKVKEEKLLGFDELFSEFARQITTYNMNNYADFTLNSDKSFKEVKPYKISRIELIWAVDYLSEKETAYVPCFKISSFNEKENERYTVINAVNGQILTTRF